MNLAIGLTSLIRGIKQNSTDGIGNYSKNIYNFLSQQDSICLHPISFGYHIDSINLLNLKVLSNFSLLVASSIFFRNSFYKSSTLLDGVDLFHSTDHRIPLLNNIPVIATIHDAIPFAYPQWVSLRHQFLVCPAFKKSVMWADKVITVSNFSKFQIMEFLNVPEDRISVIPNGVDIKWFNEVCIEKILALKNKYKITKKYFISVGTLQPRKNYERLLLAYSNLPKFIKDEFNLVIIGRNGWGVDQLVKDLHSKKFGDGIIWLDYLPDDDVHTLVKGALCFIFPSLCEGFGFPVLEAYAAGVPVLASSHSSIPEVAGDAAHLFDPFQIDDIMDSLIRIVNNNFDVNSMRNKGLNRAKDFSWTKSIDSLLSIYRSMIR